MRIRIHSSDQDHTKLTGIVEGGDEVAHVLLRLQPGDLLPLHSLVQPVLYLEYR